MPDNYDPAEMMRRAKAALHVSAPSDSLHQIVSRDPEAFLYIRLLYATDRGNAIEVPLLKDDPEIAVTGIFCGPRFLVYSEAAEQGMRRGTYYYRVKARTLVDTNFLSDLPHFYEGHPTKNSVAIAKTLKFIETSLGRGFDWSFPLLENLREVARGGNPFPYRKVAAAKFFDETGRSTPRLEGFSNEDPQLTAYFREAEKSWAAVLADPGSWEMMGRRDWVYCVLLKSMTERWAGSGVKDGLRNVVQFCLDKLDLLPLKELYFAWKILQPDSNLAILNENEFKTPTSKSLRRISALAWDLFLFRWLETQLTDTAGTDFYLPLVTSLDADLMAAIRACPLRAVLIDDRARRVEAIFDDAREFHEILDGALTPEQRDKAFDPRRKVGRLAFQPTSVGAAIHQLEKEIEKKAQRAP